MRIVVPSTNPGDYYSNCVMMLGAQQASLDHPVQNKISFSQLRSYDRWQAAYKKHNINDYMIFVSENAVRT